MLGLKKFLFRGAAPAELPADVREVLESWRAASPPSLDELHFHSRYVLVDIVTGGMQAESDPLLGIAAVSVRRGMIQPDDSFFVEFSAVSVDVATIDRQLTAFLQFTAKAPLVSYHIPYVGGFLNKAFRERLGVDFLPQWIDLAWLLPAMFEEKSHTVMPLDQWIDAFALDAGAGRRDAMTNTLLLGRIFQMLLTRAVGKQIDTAGQLVEESHASSFLRRNH